MATTDIIPPMSKALAVKAKRELREDPKTISAHMTSIRRWATSVPHIEFHFDDIVLLAFLRHAKYEHAAAQARIDNFCTLRASNKYGVPEWFQYPPTSDPRVEYFLNSGAYIPLGFTDDMIFVALIKLRNWDLDRLSRQDFFSLAYMTADRYMFDPTKHIGGFGMVIDMGGMTSKQMTSLSDRKHNKFSTKIWQEGYPVRTKFLVYYKEPMILDAVIKMVELWLNDKVKQRIIRAKDDIKRAYKKIPGLRKIMPPEYGGENTNIQSLMQEEKSGFLEFYSKEYPFSHITVDERKRPEACKSYLREYTDCKEELMGAQGTFIQFDVQD